MWRMPRALFLKLNASIIRNRLQIRQVLPALTSLIESSMTMTPLTVVVSNPPKWPMPSYYTRSNPLVNRDTISHRPDPHRTTPMPAAFDQDGIHFLYPE